MIVNIYSTLNGIENIDPANTTCIVIDVFRASTTTICLMERGLDELKVVASIEEALNLKDEGFVLIGERGARPIQGFEFDNSPYLISKFDWSGKRAVLTTSNGTRALISVQTCRNVVVAGFRNIDAIAKYVKSINDSIAIIPIGHMGEKRIEDELCAKALKRKILGLSVDWPSLVQQIWDQKNLIISANSEVHEKDLELGMIVNSTSIIPKLEKDLYLRRKV
jgi:2-phosphosulfolactate phosphatase